MPASHRQIADVTGLANPNERLSCRSHIGANGVNRIEVTVTDNQLEGHGQGQSQGQSEVSIGVENAMLILGFVRRALWRRRWIAIICFVSTMAVAVAALQIMPKTYRVDARVLTHPSYLLPNLTQPRRIVPIEAQRMTRGAVELIKSRKNLIAIIEDSNLMVRWEETRTDVGRLIDKIRASLLAPPSEADKREALVHLLDNKLWANVENEVIVFTANWHDAQTALEIVEHAKDRFLQARRDRELKEIEETITLLESNVDAVTPKLEQAAKKVEAVAKSSQRRNSIQIEVPRRHSDNNDNDSPERRAIESQLAGVRERVGGLEANYQQELRRAQQRLENLRSTLGPRHPDVISAVRELEQQSTPPQRLAELRGEEAQLSHRLSRMRSQNQARQKSEQIEQILPPAAGSVDPELERLVQDYRQLENRHNELMERLQSARIELESAKIAFGYRYIVTVPPVLPRKAIKPVPAKILIGAFVAGIFLGLFFAIVADLRSGRIHETWQLQRIVGVRLLGEVDEP